MAELAGELWMFLDCVRVAQRDARRDVRRALSEEAAVEARGNAANSCDERFIFGGGVYGGWKISRAHALDGAST